VNGGHNVGTLFELTQNGEGSWDRQLFGFTKHGQHGAYPYADLILDQAGNLYGTTSQGGTGSFGQCSGRWPYGCGTVFKVTPNSDGTWTESVLHKFTGGDGANLVAGLVFDQAGNLYGATAAGGQNGYGVIFKLAPHPNGTWEEIVLHTFAGDDGNALAGTLVFDQAGNLYGTTTAGGQYGYGVAFRLAPNSDGSWTENVLYHFTGGKDGANPYAGLIFDASGNLYGTTLNGGAYGYGVVFRLMAGSDGAWKEHVLHAFADVTEAHPQGGLIFDPAGNLYGTTTGDGITGFGSVYEITP